MWGAIIVLCLSRLITNHVVMAQLDEDVMVYTALEVSSGGVISSEVVCGSVMSKPICSLACRKKDLGMGGGCKAFRRV